MASKKIKCAYTHLSLCENCNYLAITVHETEPGDRQTDSKVLVIRSQTSLGTNYNNEKKIVWEMSVQVHIFCLCMLRKVLDVHTNYADAHLSTQVIPHS